MLLHISSAASPEKTDNIRLSPKLNEEGSAMKGFDMVVPAKVDAYDCLLSCV
ncbi:hypothetical protein [Endozoicomonas euniceicola]|uniref:Uncharacterized protein n=1 Tax=Endozoicomonas euniceicola TaxID=1234143 RepID=A0ABY6GS95_9GAMM|nr:hypothetical protein [Endozoicomonas euniceicola]UYM14953.1 hypothetical protein NX720_18970 [Endozoicomonas euniceicola]